MAPVYVNEPNVDVRQIPGLRFHYTNGRLDLPKSIARGFSYLGGLKVLARELANDIRREQPELILTDFDPALPRAAEMCGLPYHAIDHQNFLMSYDLSDLPFGLRNFASAMSLAVSAHYSRQESTVVSSFFKTPLRTTSKNVTQVGPFIRQDIREARPAEGEHVICYFRKHTPKNVVELVGQLNVDIRVYGLGERPPIGKLQFRPFDKMRFVDELASCRAYIGAAGNQTLGEALFLGKPVMALPETQHHEQRINAFYLKQMGAGDFRFLEQVQLGDLRDFLSDIDCFASEAANYQGRLDGTAAALAHVRGLLPKPARQPALADVERMKVA